MTFRDYILQEETYTLSLLQEIIKLFPDRRFIMSHASGSSVFVGYEKDVYEIRIEPAAYAQSHAPGRSPSDKALEILDKIKQSSILDGARDVNGEMAIVGKYSPTRDSATETSSRDLYKITVAKWQNSPYKQFFLNQKMRRP